VLLLQDKLDKVEYLKEIFKNRKTPIIVFCDALEGDALSSIIKNMNENEAFPPVAFIRNPKFEKAEHKDYFMEDLAAIFGAKIFGTMRGAPLSSLTPKNLGTIKKISATITDTKVSFDRNDEIENRIEIAKELSKTDEFHRMRLSYLTIGIGTLYLSAYTPQEYMALYDSAEDAVLAGLKATEYGAVIGGGRALCIAAEFLDKKTTNTDYNAGYSAVLKGIKYPFDKMWELSFPAKKMPKYEGSWGMNFKTKTEQDLIKGGIVDSLKSITVALDTATSAACTLIETDTLIIKDEL
jgi:chaperonin GroEL (HSP60 family)